MAISDLSVPEITPEYDRRGCATPSPTCRKSPPPAANGWQCARLVQYRRRCPPTKSCARAAPNLLPARLVCLQRNGEVRSRQVHQQFQGEQRSLGGRFKAQLDALVGFQEIGG